MRALGHVLRDAWRLTAPYFRSEERLKAWLLLGFIVAAIFVMNGLNVVLNYWNAALVNALTEKNFDGFLELLLTYRSGPEGFMPGFVPILLVYVPFAIYRTYLNQVLQIRWRRWMTDRLLTEWLSDRAYYTMSVSARAPATTGLTAGMAGADNPDQRIADDMRTFVEGTLSLGLGLLSNVVNLVSFSIILWGLSGALTVWGLTIPGYLFWIALLYAALGSYLTQLVGRPLAQLEFHHQRTEANFRFGLARLRENTEGIALLGGEAEEKAGLAQQFAALYANWMQLIGRRKWLSTLTVIYGQVSSIFSIVIVAPRYFAGAINLGQLFQVSGAFDSVQGSMSWFIDAYSPAVSSTSSLTFWRANVARLTGFREAVAAARAATQAGLAVQTGTGPDLRMDSATVALPDGTPLLRGETVRFTPGRSTVISGRSGSGKSTLFRALAGIWPFGAGHIERPAGTSLFLPQRPYIPLGTLRHAICYPAPADRFPDEALQQALHAVGLAALSDHLDADEPWPQRLSGGEQQRLAIARALLLRPDWLFMDEATANLDPEGEADLYAMLRRTLPGTTIISIAHRPAVKAFHDEALVFRRLPGQPGTLDAAAQPVPVAPG